MKVKELKQLLEDCNDEMDVLIPVSLEFDGRFYSPCCGESGTCQIEKGPPDPIYQTPEEEATAPKPPETEEVDVFMLVPCGFHEEHDHEHLMN